ncbi:MAG: T9SS type A sorting domain-containing protein [Lewinellaceae bacterium]|nr:zinc-dependent metalloprotease [Phaeodactylibacter sp.]MCB0611752.1 zinc-dependent metalloprotease [Phaeodactylibacter sp.]MCB9350888.1 T9SS type A sorting domain-containing protein [Lewinellaceae bacterium]
MYKIKLCLAFLWLTTAIFAQNTPPLWQETEAPARPGFERVAVPKSFRVLLLNTDAMVQQLAGAPAESVANASVSGYTLELPRPDGRMEAFRICESPIMAPGLAQRFPGIKTYLGKGVDNPTALVRLDYTPHGFHAMVLAGEGTYFIDPYYHLLNDGTYQSYFKKDYQTDKAFTCEAEEWQRTGDILEGGLNGVGEQLRIYRLALACTGEYAQYHGGTVEQATAAMVTTMNRVNGLFERDFSVRMMMIDSNHLITFTNPSSDPYSGGNVLGQNQTAVDQYIGTANYDIGHLVDTGGGGVAFYRSICSSQNKARGYTGLNPPVGDPFDVDYVAHEMGHQFGGSHTFNGTLGSCSGGNRNGPTAFEPGSGVTIMAYAGICGSDNIASNSIDHFHNGSLDEMTPYIVSGAANFCAERDSTGNTAPLVEAGPSGHVIPISTPFELTGSATDMEGDALTYCWEQVDVGPGGNFNNPVGNAPLFRSFSPTTDSTRVFPRISAIVNNTSSLAEVLPFYARNLTFRLTARDNHGFGGGVEWDTRSLIVSDQAGPFEVLSQNTSTTWEAGSFQQIEWDVANTDQAPVNADRMNIFLSMDGGFTYPILLADSLENNGSALVFIPDTLQGNQFRVKVKAVGNVFFDINNRNITITPATEPGFALGTPAFSQLACGEQPLTYEVMLQPRLGFEGEITLTAEGLPGEASAEIESPLLAPAQVTVTVTNLQGLASGLYPFQLIAGSGAITDTLDLLIELYANVPGPVTLLSPVEGEPEVSTSPTLSWAAGPDAATYRLEGALDPGFTDIFFSEEGLTGTSYDVPVELPDSSLIFWRVQGINPGCGAGPYSESFFETEVIICEVFTTDSLPFSMAAPNPIVISTITVDKDIIVRDVNILGLNGFHVPISDLNFRFRSPEGPIIDLITQDCGIGISFNLSLDDAAAEEVPCPYADGGVYRPEEELKIYNGQNARGDWQLLLAKDQDNGTLREWAIEICYPKPLTSVKEARQPIPQLKIFPNPASTLLQVELPGGLQPGARLHISSIAGQSLTEQNVRALSGTERVDISRLPAGLYFLQLFSREGQILGNNKFVKE